MTSGTGTGGDTHPPRPGRFGTLSTSRLGWGGALTVAGLPLVTAALVAARPSVSLAGDLVIYLLAVVVIAVVGGMWVALVAAVAAFLLANWYLTPPFHTFDVESEDSLVALLVFVAVAVVVSAVVELGAVRRVEAARAQAEADALARFTEQPLNESSLTAVLAHVRELFGMRSVALVRSGVGGSRDVLGRVGPPDDAAPSLAVESTAGIQLEATGPAVFAEDRALLGRLAETAVRAYEGEQLVVEAARSEQLAEVDRLRAALLAAVGHDLRTPLAGIKAAVSSLRQADVAWTPEEQAELLATVEESADRLDDLINNLLDISRLQSGALIVSTEPVSLEEVVARAIISQSASDLVTVSIDDDLPLLVTDAGLLERVIANLLDNACRYAPTESPVVVTGTLAENSIAIAVVDGGPGIDPAQHRRLFEPFQRGDDRGASSGVGLGLAIARGFAEALGGSVTPSETVGGGLTMTVTVPLR